MYKKINILLRLTVFILLVPYTFIYATSKDMWVYPTKSVCIKHKGFYDASKQLCEANFNNGVKICKMMGAKLPTLQDYKQIAKVCGAIFFKGNENCYREDRDNPKYRKCYAKMGFSRIGDYFTLTKHVDKDYSNYYYTFNFLQAKTAKAKKTNGRFIACIKE